MVHVAVDFSVPLWELYFLVVKKKREEKIKYT